jgi:hypothetical protein
MSGGSAVRRPHSQASSFRSSRKTRMQNSANFLLEYCSDPHNFGRVLWDFDNPEAIEASASNPHTVALEKILEALTNYQLPENLPDVSIPETLAAMHNNAIDPRSQSTRDFYDIPAQHPAGIKLLKIEIISNEALMNINKTLCDLRGADDEHQLVYHGASEQTIRKIIDEGFGKNFAKITEHALFAYGAGVYAAANVDLNEGAQGFSLTGEYSPIDHSREKHTLLCLTRTGPVAQGHQGQKDFGSNLFLSNRSGTIKCAENGLYFWPIILVKYISVLVGPVQIDELVTYEDENGHHWNFPHIVPPRLGIYRDCKEQRKFDVYFYFLIEELVIVVCSFSHMEKCTYAC